MTQPDDSGIFPQIRRSTVWIPVSLVVMAVGIAIAWGVNTQRLGDLEKRQEEGNAERIRMEDHLNSGDRQIAVLQANYVTIIEQLRALNTKLDRAEDARQAK